MSLTVDSCTCIQRETDPHPIPLVHSTGAATLSVALKNHPAGCDNINVFGKKNLNLPYMNATDM